MVGNWGQHAFVDKDEPDSDFRSSITLIDVAVGFVLESLILTKSLIAHRAIDIVSMTAITPHIISIHCDIGETILLHFFAANRHTHHSRH